eukprot:gene3542-3879_t
MIGLTVEEVDIFQYVDCPFVINVQLTDLVTNQVKLGEILPTVKVLLAYEGNASTEQRCLEHHPHLIEVIHNVGIQANGKAQIWVKLKGLSMNHDNQRFVVYLEAYRPQGERTIICAITNPFTAVRYKLIISEANSSPYVWYKDEGAKDKCIKVLIKLVDAQKALVKSRRVPLAASLIYSSGQAVQPSSVLSIFHEKDKGLQIGSTGTEIIRFRVNEVSRNHRKQMFHLLVTPDTREDPEARDISPATSIAFEVKSKRTVLERRDNSVFEDSSEDTPILPMKRSRGMENNQIPHVGPILTGNTVSLLSAPSLPNSSSSSSSSLSPYNTPRMALLELRRWVTMAQGLLAQSNEQEARTASDLYLQRVLPHLRYLDYFVDLQEESTALQGELLFALSNRRQNFDQQMRALLPTLSQTNQSDNPVVEEQEVLETHSHE